LRVGCSVFAIDNFDPVSEVNVLSRGIVGDIQGEYVVASPIYKQHFSLTTGRCLEDPSKSVNVYPARVVAGHIWVNPAVTGIELFTSEYPEDTADCEDIVFRDTRREVYKRLRIRDNRLQGAVLHGDVRHGQWYLELMTRREDITALRHQLMFGPPPPEEVSAQQMNSG
jgi:NAD(P)H-dependent nitrite reductase small subunit